MALPPNQYRRRKLRRRVALGLLLLTTLAGAGSYAYWQDTRFPARSLRMAGTPVELRVQDGVGADELVAIRTGLRLTDGFMRRVLGRSVRTHLESRIARSNGCEPFQSAAEGIVGEAYKGFLCIDTASPAWQWLMLKDRLAAMAAAGHEYVHVLQDEIGCLQSPLDERYRWIMEGMAEEVSWRALVAAGRTNDTHVAGEIRSAGAFDPNLEPLHRYEIDSGRDPEYALWHLAVRRLLHEAVSAAAAPAGRPELALRHFCDRVAHREPWRLAFRRSFGTSVKRFYRAFATFRREAVDRFGDTWR